MTASAITAVDAAVAAYDAGRQAATATWRLQYGEVAAAIADLLRRAAPLYFRAGGDVPGATTPMYLVPPDPAACGTPHLTVVLGANVRLTIDGHNRYVHEGQPRGLFWVERCEGRHREWQGRYDDVAGVVAVVAETIGRYDARAVAAGLDLPVDTHFYRGETFERVGQPQVPPGPPPATTTATA